jgi:inner membrane protein
LSRIATRSAVIAGAVAVVVLVDRSIWRPGFPWPAKAVCDEAAHLATTALVVSPFASRPDRRLVLGALVGSVALDADHIPIYAGLLPDRGRPKTHSLATVAFVAAIACLLPPQRRGFLSGLGVGLASHLLRDALTGGAPLLWPWSSRMVGVQVAPERPRHAP